MRPVYYNALQLHVCKCAIKCFRLRCVCVCLRCSWFRMKDTQKQVIFIKGVSLLLSVQSGSRAFVTHRAGTTRTIFHYTLTLPPRPSRLHTEGHPIRFCHLHKSPPRLSLSKQDKSPANRPRRKGTPGRRESQGSHPPSNPPPPKKQVPITQKRTKRIQLRYNLALVHVQDPSRPWPPHLQEPPGEEPGISDVP